MVFVLESGGPTFTDAAVVGSGWPYSIQVPLWGAKARQLLPSFAAPFGTKHPNVSVTSAVALRSSAPSSGIVGGPVRARAWTEPGCSTFCSHVIVVNLDRESPVQFTLSLTNLQLQHMVDGGGSAVVYASRIFDAGYNVTLTDVTESSATLSDFLAPDVANVYEIGCDGPRPMPCIDPATAEPCHDHRTWNGSALDWSCASRRVLCKDGFVAKDPFNATCQA